MKFRVLLAIYRLLLPLWLVFALPGWLVKMSRRGGWGSGLWERLGCYGGDPEWEPCGAVHVHAISVGETLLALKLMRAWRKRDAGVRFVLAVGTATGHEVARQAAMEGVRVAYAPVDLPWSVGAYLRRFEPAQVVLVEGEMWPNLMLGLKERGVPVVLANARMSPRSERRYRSLVAAVGPIFGLLDRVLAQSPGDEERWAAVGVVRERVKVVGSMKFDAGSGRRPERRELFQEMIDGLELGGVVVLLASTHEGEEVLLVRAVREAVPGARILVVPRHAERRVEVKEALVAVGERPVLRSLWQAGGGAGGTCLIVDSTGELADWTAHADGVVIGKSFLGVGGQNPVEAVMAGKALWFGPHMENFEPLASALVEVGGAERVVDDRGLVKTLQRWNEERGKERKGGIEAAKRLLEEHEGAVERTLDALGA